MIKSIAKIFGNISSNLKYLFRSVKFWAAIAGYLALLIFATSDYNHETAEVWYLLRYSRAFGSYYFSLVICALPGAGAFAEEWCSERFVFSYLRTGKKDYAVSMVLSSFLSAFSVAFIGTALYIGILSLKCPVTNDPSDVMFIQAMRG